MVLPTGAISMADLNVEIGASSTAPISLNDSLVRITAGVSSGAIAMSDLQGKSYFRITGGTTVAYGTNSRVGAGSVTTTSSIASSGSIVGGVSPYTYLWQYVSGDTFTVLTPSVSSTSFRRSETVTFGQEITRVGVYRCQVTDANGLVTYGPNCTVTLSFSEAS